MKAATLTEVRTIALDGIKPVWKITKAAECINIDGRTFVRVSSTNYGLGQLVTTNLEDDSQTYNVWKNGNMSLKGSKGLADIIAIRNRVQAETFEASSHESTPCTLFEAKPAKKIIEFG